MIPLPLIRRALFAGLALLLASHSPAPAQVPATEYEGAQALGLSLRSLGHTKRVLMVGAHPDDESTQILSTLALGQGAQVAYLSLTRGEGGQNGIGPELQEGLGLLRTEELLAARRLDGARQYFTRAYDFGFSKTAEEAFRHWPRDSVLADVVAVIRDFRPDIVLSVFSGTPRDGHGQHQAAGILAREAFSAAGDSQKFPEQLVRGLRPHQASRLYQAPWWPVEDPEHRLQTGEMDPLLGRSYYQVAMASRSRHRSQDMGQILAPGPRSSELAFMEGSPPPAGGGLFAGLDTTLAMIAAARAPDAATTLAAYEEAVTAAVERYDVFRPEESVARLASALEVLEGATPTGDPVLAFHVAAERVELEHAIWEAAGLRLDATAADESLVPGQEVEVALTLWNGGSSGWRIERLQPELPQGWSASPIDPAPAEIAAGELVRRRFLVRVPHTALPTEPYFLVLPRQGDLYTWPDSLDVGVPFGPQPVRASAAVTIHGHRITRAGDATHQTLDKMQGEIRRPVRVVPAVSVTVEPNLAILPLEGRSRGPIPLVVRLRAEAPDGISGAVRPVLPPGWSADPEELAVRFASAGEERVLEMAVHPPAEAAPGAHLLQMSFVTESGASFEEGYRLVDYPHTAPRALYTGAAARVQALDVQVPQDLRVGYIAGPGDEVQEALRQLGVEVEPLDAKALASSDLSRYDVIVTGIRAYETRPDLVAHNQRLLDYTAQGGTFIVQYSQYEFTRPGMAPYGISMSRPHDRVTDETAQVRLLQPEHPVFTRPNRITDADFGGWVQERGLYFLSEWDDALVPLVETGDPGSEPLRGGLLIAAYGEGTYVYTGLAFFRQLPAGVPGAYRLFANLLALGSDR